ncbi:MAG TPA: hypothetical protein VJ596_04040 [Gemmatimonadaceae bacterium]|nr:hypothetical protein [Gemmatimonadaceae bacterium]
MKAPRGVALAFALPLLAGCNPFRQDPPTEINRNEIPLTNRWNATLGTPSTLAGAIQIRGTAWMGSQSGSNETRVEIRLSNATPGGVHPWHVHRGQCGSDQGIWGDAGEYETITINDEGNGSGAATISEPTPSDGQYYVNVHASPSNLGTIVACGNLAPPAR